MAINQDITEALDWLRRLAANARKVNDGEGEALALRAEQCQRVIEAFLVDWGITSADKPPFPPNRTLKQGELPK